MARILIKSLERKILFETNDKNLVEMLKSDFPRRIIPSYGFSEKIDRYDVKVGYYLSNNFLKEYRFPNIRICVGGYSKAEVPFLLLHVFERLYEEDGKYAVECAAVEKDNNGILLCGDSGSGKTSVTLYLLNLGYNFISNETTIIDRKRIYGGTDVLNIKEHGLRYVPDKYLKKLKRVDYTKNYHTYLLSIPAVENPVKYKMIFKIVTVPIETEAKIFELPRGFMNLRFFEYSSSLIRGVIPLNNFRNVADSLDNDELSEKRIRDLFLIDIPCYIVFGSVENVARKIDEVYRDVFGK